MVGIAVGVLVFCLLNFCRKLAKGGAEEQSEEELNPNPDDFDASDEVNADRLTVGDEINLVQFGLRSESSEFEDELGISSNIFTSQGEVKSQVMV